MKSLLILSFFVANLLAKEPRVIKPSITLVTKGDGLVYLRHDDKLDNRHLLKEVSNLDEATELMGGSHFKINGQIPYEIVPIPHFSLNEEEIAERQLFNTQSRNRFMRRIARYQGKPLFSDAAYKESQGAIDEINTLRSQFSNFEQRNSLEMENLRRNTLPRFQSLRVNLQSRANSLNNEIRDLQSKIASGELNPENCGFIRFGGKCVDNKSRLANKTAMFNDYISQIDTLETGADQLASNIEREIGGVEKKLDLTDEEFKNKIVDIIKKSGSFTLKEEATLLKNMVEKLKDALVVMLDQLRKLNQDVTNLKAESGLARQQIDVEQLKVDLKSEFDEKLKAAKEEAVALACNEAPSCAGPSFQVQGAGSDDSARSATPSPLSSEELDNVGDLLNSISTEK